MQRDPTPDGSTLWRTLKAPRNLFLIAGPCALESEDLGLQMGKKLKQICANLEITFIFKASYDKANRSSGRSYRGPGLAE